MSSRDGGSRAAQILGAGLPLEGQAGLVAGGWQHIVGGGESRETGHSLAGSRVFGSEAAWVEPQGCHFLAGWLWASDLTLLSFFLVKQGQP